MTHVILRYRLDCPEVTLAMPGGARVLTARLQGPMDHLYIWVECDEKASMQHRTFIVLNTGKSFDATGLRYIATCETQNGIVWHVYEQEGV
jgi:hypothetical protein